MAADTAWAPLRTGLGVRRGDGSGAGTHLRAGEREYAAAPNSARHMVVEMITQEISIVATALIRSIGRAADAGQQGTRV